MILDTCRGGRLKPSAPPGPRGRARNVLNSALEAYELPFLLGSNAEDLIGLAVRTRDRVALP